MTILPIVERELRVAARRPITYRARFWAVCIVLGLVAWKVFSFARHGVPGALHGPSLFNTISAWAFAYVMLMGARLTSDCLSREKREDTLGLLFLTDLKPWDVVMGKLAASSLGSFYGLIAILPITALPLLLGGVTLLQVAQMSVLLLNTLFFSLCAGLLMSAISRNDRKALMGTVLLILVPVVAPAGVFIYRMFVQEVQLTGPADLDALAVWLIPDPVYGLVYLIGPKIPTYTPPPWTFWLSVGLVHLMAWTALLLTMIVMPFVWKERVWTGVIARLKMLLEKWSRGAGSAREAFRREWLRINPFVWLMARDRLKPWYAWIFVISVIVIWRRGHARYGDVMFDFYPLIPTAILIHLVIKLWVLAESTHRLVEDQRSGALELLLVTPLTIPNILRGQFLALRRQFGLPLLGLGIIELIVFFQWYHWTVILAGLTMLLVDAVTLVWVGMYLSLFARSLNRVLFWSMSLVLILPWPIFLVALELTRWIHERFFVAGEKLSFEFRVFLWLAVGLLTDFLIGYCWARPKLLRQTNSSIVQRFVLKRAL